MVTRTHDTSKKSISEETACRVPYTSLYDALHFRDAVDGQNLKAKNDISTPNNNSEEEEEHGNFQQRPNDLPTVSTEYHTSLTKISVSYHALHGVSSIGLRFDAIYGPRGFGVSSTSVPIFHEGRKRRRGVSPDVDLAEVAVRGLYRRWTDANKDKQEKEEDKDGEDGATKKEEERQLNFIEEAGWMHLAHDRRDFVFVEGKRSHMLSSISHVMMSISDTLLPSYLFLLQMR